MVAAYLSLQALYYATLGSRQQPGSPRCFAAFLSPRLHTSSFFPQTKLIVVCFCGCRVPAGAATAALVNGPQTQGGALRAQVVIAG